MKQKGILLIAVISFILGQNIFAGEPDSAYIFSYSTLKNRSTNGLHFAWSTDNENWHTIGPEFSYLNSDFGTWGSQKKMINPFLFKDEKSLWHCLWTLNNETGQFAHATSVDLINWGRQSYPEVIKNGSVSDLEVFFKKVSSAYQISWLNSNDSKIYTTSTTDFKNYSPTGETKPPERLFIRKTIEIDGEKQVGIICKVSWESIDKLIKWYEWNNLKQLEREDNTSKDVIRFADLKSPEAVISVNPEKSKNISDMLIGIFFEDINYAADGGLYAELVQNRGFEYQLSDKKYSDKTWNCYKAWSFTGNNASFTIDSVSPVHQNNKHFALLEIQKPSAILSNEGFDGIPVKAGEKFNFSVFAKTIQGKKIPLVVKLTDNEGKTIASSEIKINSGNWENYETSLYSTKSCDKSKLEIIPQLPCKIGLDMISLFPQNTFKGRKNGLRNDLAQTIADLKPRFVRFPGGCVAHGDGLGNIYHWNRTIGPLESRVPQRNIWNYHQTAGLGYFEYFQFCEDIGAEPLPVLAAGVPCQNSSDCGHGQQGGIPLCEMDVYIQEVLDLIEWANGDKNTKWGKIRAEAGHPEPFNLKFVGIGNEDLISDVFEERFTMIFNAVKEKHPEITVIGTVGPFYTGTDYVEGWKLADKLGVLMVDEHYYQTPGWFIHNQDFYDRYDRSKSKVYLGEYAAHLPGRPVNIETALSEALYLLSVERNADVVSMTSYAPLLAKEGFTQWNPDLIYFTNTEVKPTVGYFVQKMFGQNSGNVYIPSQIKLSEKSEDVKKRVAVSVVKDVTTNDVIIKLVNLLPVNVKSELDLSGLNIVKSDAELTVLQGNTVDKNAKPVSSKIEVSELIKYELPAYSFSVIRIKQVKS